MFKRSSASWLEDQDFWRFSGIFRDVFLYAVPTAHVRDIKVIADYDGTNGIFSAVLDIEGNCSVKAVLTNQNGTVVAESNEKETINRTIGNVEPWSAETNRIAVKILQQCLNTSEAQIRQDWYIMRALQEFRIISMIILQIWKAVCMRSHRKSKNI